MAHSVNLVGPLQLHDAWPFVKRGLDGIIRKTHPDWVPEDIYAMVRAGQLQLVLLNQEDRRIGFTAYCFNVFPFSGKKELFVLCSWTLPLRERLPSDEVDKGIAFCFEFLCNVARAQGATCITALSPRPAWLRWSDRLRMGFKYVHSAYRREL